MEPQTQTTSSFSAPTPQPQKTGKNKTVLWVAIVVVVAAVTAAGVYFWQQTQVDSLNRDKNTLTMQANQAKANAQVDAKIFTASKVPFTFNYPENWALASATPILSGGDLPESYSINLYSPGAVDTQQPTGGTAVAHGGKITIAVSKAPAVSTPRELTASLPGVKTEIKDVTVAETPAVEYEYFYDTPVVLYTQFVRSGKKYSIALETGGGGPKDSSQYEDYKALVSSFAFK